MFLGNMKMLHRHMLLTTISLGLLAAVAVIGHTGLSTVGGEMDHFVRWSDIDMVMNEDVTQRALCMVNAVRTYKTAPKAENYDAMVEGLASVRKGLDGWLEMLADLPKLQEQAVGMVPHLDAMGTTMSAYRDVQVERKSIVGVVDTSVNTVADELGRVMVEVIDPAKERAEQAQDISEMVRWSEIDMVMNEGVIANALKLLVAVHDYAYDPAPERFEKVNQALAFAHAGLKEWSGLLAGEELLETTASDTAKAYDAIKSAVEELGALNRKEADMDAAIGGVVQRVMDTTEKIMVEYIDPAKENAQVMAHEITEATTAKMLWVSVVAFVLVLIVSLYVVLSEASILNRVTNMAEFISKGDFSHSFKLSQKDEYGKLSRALGQIENSVSGLMDECETLIGGIEQGHLHVRGDKTRFQGGYASMIDGINAVADTMVSFVDLLPVGAIVRSPDRKLLFLNEAAKSIAGLSSCAGMKCEDVFNTEDCKGTCATDLCLETKQVESSETVARPATGEYEISYSGVPLFSRTGEVTGVFEVIVDQTAIKRTQRTILNVTERANVIADRVASASEELAAQVEEVKGGAEIQQQRVGETATAMEEMTATVLDVARNAEGASQQSDDTTGKAEEGAGLVDQVIAAISKVNSAARGLQSNMEQLGQQAEAIGGVMTVITDIADQTNLLALNAAIEAARAGEAGRGFAVVADEVRKLAEKTVAATSEVGGSIVAIQNAARSNVESVGEAVDNVGQATELATDSGEALGQIVSLASESRALIGNIATAVEEQSATSEEINRALLEVNQIVMETTEGMVQSTDAVQELAQMANELKAVLEELHEVET